MPALADPVVELQGSDNPTVKVPSIRGRIPIGVYPNGRPESRLPKSVLLDLAYQEYCDLLEAGEKVSVEAFCARFPHMRSSLFRVIELHHYYADRGVQPQPALQGTWPEPGEK